MTLLVKIALLVMLGLASDPPVETQIIGKDRIAILRRLQVAPRKMHTDLYMATARCVKVHPATDSLTWHVAEAIYNVTTEQWALGVYLPERRAIILAWTHAWDPQVITHEAIHDLTGMDDPLPEEIRKRCEVGYR